MAALDENPILELGRTPIPGPAPTGADTSSDEEYILLSGEIGKMDRIESEEPDWFQMEQAGTVILTSKSKDVEVAAWLGAALFKRYNYEGLAAALGLLTELVRNFWDNLFPERPRRRKSRIEFLTDRFTEAGWFRDHPPGANDFDAVDLCVARIQELDAALRERMPDDPPEFDKFIRGCKELAGRRPAPAAAQPSADAPAATGAAPAAGAAGGFSPGEVADVSGAVSAILGAASFIRKADPADPIPYAVVRVVKWSQMALPASDAAKYQIEPPEGSLLEALPHQFANSLWENLLKNAEAAFRSGDPLWLDLQRYVCAAMVGLGPAYDNARHAVITATAGLVRRLGEGLYDLKFRGGMALCGGETRMWIESEVMPRSEDGAGGAGNANGRLTEATGKARELVGTGKVKEAVAELQQGLMTCSERRDRLLWRLQIARLCFESQRLQLALPLLEECFEEIRRYRIDEWEPSLAVEVAQALYRCRKACIASEKEPAPESLQGLRDSFAWLCQLDPLAAFAVEPSGK